MNGRDAGSVNHAETESDGTDQSGLTKEQCTDSSSTHQAVASAATRDTVWFPLNSNTLYKPPATSLRMQRFHRDALTSAGETNLCSCQPIPHTVYLTLALGDATPCKMRTSDGTMAQSDGTLKAFSAFRWTQNKCTRKTGETSRKCAWTCLSFAEDGKLLQCPVCNNEAGLLADSLAVVAGVVFNALPRVHSRARG